MMDANTIIFLWALLTLQIIWFTYSVFLSSFSFNLLLSLSCIETTYFPTFKLQLWRNILKNGIVSIADIIYPTRSGEPSVVSTSGTSVCCDGQDVLTITTNGSATSTNNTWYIRPRGVNDISNRYYAIFRNIPSQLEFEGRKISCFNTIQR